MDQSLSESMTLLNAQIGFLDTHVALIHIPLSLYPYFTHALTRLLLHNTKKDEDDHVASPSRPWQYWHPFTNVSITSNECSVVCPRAEAHELFGSALSNLGEAVRNSVSISADDYAVITIGGAGLEAGERVLDLTTPLAIAGISIYFITSYWSDYILVPFNARTRVIRALEERGFVFEAESASGDAGHMTNPASPLMHARHRNSSSTSSFEYLASPGTPPASNVSELQARTFKTLRMNNISPRAGEVELVTCASVKSTTASSQAADPEGKLQLGLLKCLTTFPPPRFLSLTLTDTESASVTLDKELLPLFANGGEDLLLGKDGPEQVAITLDLHGLPQESTGIVCGVASRLIEGMKGRIGGELFNMSYLSTVRAGHVLVYQDELEDAMASLRGAELNGVNGHT